MFDNFRWPLGTRVTKTKGSQWTGKVVGFYSTNLTAEGYAVESETERGSVQIYPVAALRELGDVAGCSTQLALGQLRLRANRLGRRRHQVLTHAC